MHRQCKRGDRLDWRRPGILELEKMVLWRMRDGLCGLPDRPQSSGDLRFRLHPRHDERRRQLAASVRLAGMRKPGGCSDAEDNVLHGVWRGRYIVLVAFMAQ